MSTHDEYPQARIRFDPVVPGWRVATVDGVRLATAPVREADTELAARELARVLGEPLNVDIYDELGHIERMHVYPGTEQARRVPD